MNIEDLYIKLKKSYTLDNLNKISSNIICYYRNKEYSYIRGLSKVINHFIDINEGKINKIFSRLIMLYHPDKLGYYQEAIEKYYHTNNIDKLNQLSHILQTLNYNINNNQNTIIDSEILTPQDMTWGYDDEDLDYFTEISSEYMENSEYNESSYTQTYTDFLSALKRKEYGNLNINLNYHDLELIEGELELADYEVENISGIEYCKNITTLNLSNNIITDISKLVNLKLLKEINLSNNQISDLLVLSKLENLKSIDISDNLISDLNPLFDLHNIEYLNIIGNTIPTDQIKFLKNNGIIVIH